MFPFFKSENHLGIVLDVSSKGFGKSATAMGSIFQNDGESHKFYLFYTAASDREWSSSRIGLATSTNGVRFDKKIDNLMIDDAPDSFCCVQALNPAVTKIKNRFFMVFSGKRSLSSPRTIGLAYADAPEGSWQVIGELVRPSMFWEGNGIDNGCSICKINEETMLLYYSSLTSPKRYDFTTFVRRYPVRRIGVLKVRVRGTSLSNIEVMRYNGNPLKHLNGPKGSWNESVFCPGYMRLDGINYLFPTGSTYSVGYPYRQYIGVATSSTPYFSKTEAQLIKLIDGPKEKTEILPDAKSEIALDTPCPYIDQEKQRLHLYYSVADRADEKWKIALTTYDLHSKIE